MYFWEGNFENPCSVFQGAIFKMVILCGSNFDKILGRVSLEGNIKNVFLVMYFEEKKWKMSFYEATLKMHFLGSSFESAFLRKQF